MRGLFSTVLLSLAVVGLAAGHDVGAGNGDGLARRRKTLGFGPRNPKAVFRTNPEHIPEIAQGLKARGVEDEDPLEIAYEFAMQVTRSTRSAAVTFRIRDDSYTDKSTGVSHVYVRQVIFGVEVADGDMNINIKDGKVISYGDSVSAIQCLSTSCRRLTFPAVLEG
jgi:extracellular elastinolytic metalloproteinase